MNFKKFMCFMLVGVTTFSGVQQVNAAGVTSGKSTVKDVDNNTLYESTSSEWSYQSEAEVSYDNNDYVADVLVVVPKKIALDDTKTAEYDVTVKGEIEQALGVSVAPHDELPDVEGVNFKMSTEGKDDVIANVEQESTVWQTNEVTQEGTVKKGTVTAEDLTRGQWRGSLKFDINMGEAYGYECNPDDLSDASHKWVNGFCSGCGAFDAAKHNHEYESKVTKEATCSEAGETSYTCKCGESYTEPIAMKAHNYVDGTCSECGADESLGYGLFAEDGSLLASWQSLVDDYGLNVSANYTSINQEGSLGNVLSKDASFATATRLVVGKDVEVIGDYALAAVSNLTKIELPESLKKIGNYGFRQNWKLVSIDIPAGVTDIGSVPFSFCRDLVSINVAEGNASYQSEDGVLYRGSTLLEYPMGKECKLFVSKSGTTSIGDFAFSHSSKLEEVSFDGISSIGAQAFVNSSIKSLDLSVSSVSAIPQTCFDGCGNLLIANLNTSSMRSIASRAFARCSALKYIYIPDCVTSIEGNAMDSICPFYGCPQLQLCCEFSSAKQNSFGTQWIRNGDGTNCTVHVNFQYSMFQTIWNNTFGN